MDDSVVASVEGSEQTVPPNMIFLPEPHSNAANQLWDHARIPITGKPQQAGR
jgi:hypothetical protein